MMMPGRFCTQLRRFVVEENRPGGDRERRRDTERITQLKRDTQDRIGDRDRLKEVPTNRAEKEREKEMEKGERTEGKSRGQMGPGFSS